MNVYDGIVIDKVWVGLSPFWVIPGCEDLPYVQTWAQVARKRLVLAAIWVFGAAGCGPGVVVAVVCSKGFGSLCCMCTPLPARS